MGLTRHIRTPRVTQEGDVTTVAGSDRLKQLKYGDWWHTGIHYMVIRDWLWNPKPDSPWLNTVDGQNLA